MVHVHCFSPPSGFPNPTVNSHRVLFHLSLNAIRRWTSRCLCLPPTQRRCRSPISEHRAPDGAISYHNPAPRAFYERVVHGQKQRNKIAIVGVPADGHRPSKPVTGGGVRGGHLDLRVERGGGRWVTVGAQRAGDPLARRRRRNSVDYTHPTGRCAARSEEAQNRSVNRHSSFPEGAIGQWRAKLSATVR